MRQTDAQHQKTATIAMRWVRSKEYVKSLLANTNVDDESQMMIRSLKDDLEAAQMQIHLQNDTMQSLRAQLSVAQWQKDHLSSDELDEQVPAACESHRASRSGSGLTITSYPSPLAPRPSPLPPSPAAGDGDRRGHSEEAHHRSARHRCPHQAAKGAGPRRRADPHPVSGRRPLRHREGQSETRAKPHALPLAATRHRRHLQPPLSPTVATSHRTSHHPPCATCRRRPPPHAPPTVPDACRVRC
jgi:hypothetical protein